MAKRVEDKDTIYNPKTRRWIKNTAANRRRIAKSNSTATKCKDGKLHNPKTGRCVQNTAANRKRLGVAVTPKSTSRTSTTVKRGTTKPHYMFQEHVGGHSTVYRLVDFNNLDSKGNRKPISVHKALELLRDDPAFAAMLSSTIASSPHAAVFWEVAPVTKANASEKVFEFVMPAAGPVLANANAKPFAFLQPMQQCAGEETCTFSNLAGDADLVVPMSKIGVDANVYTHLAAFVRGAPPRQQAALWRAVGTRALAQLKKRKRGEPLFISTHGIGVPWLHVRIENTPKYYTYGPYRTA